MSVQAEVSIGTLDPELCEGTWQEILEAFFSVVTITMPITLKTVNYGSTPPGPDDLTMPWIRSTEAGLPDYTYVYYSGQWLCRHPLPPGMIMLYMGTAASVTTLDGGENTPVGVDGFTGPFWEIVTELEGRFPLGVSVDYALDATGGEKEHILTNAETALHTHGWDLQTVAGSPTNFGIWAQTGDIGSCELLSQAITPGGSNDALVNIAEDGGTTPPGGEAHNNMPPYRALYFIKRTDRLYRRV